MIGNLLAIGVNVSNVPEESTRDKESIWELGGTMRDGPETE
jgi:hypothetical protein